MANDLEGGKFYDEAEIILRANEARLVAVIVLGGKKGEGFSVSTTHDEYLKLMPSVLRQMATEIEAQQGVKPS